MKKKNNGRKLRGCHRYRHGRPPPATRPKDSACEPLGLVVTARLQHGRAGVEVGSGGGGGGREKVSGGEGRVYGHVEVGRLRRVNDVVDFSFIWLPGVCSFMEAAP